MKEIINQLLIFLSKSWLFFISAIMIWITGNFIIKLWFPVQRTPIEFDIYFFNGFPIPMSILFILSIGLSIGWAAHGVGFKLIEVHKSSVIQK